MHTQHEKSVVVTRAHGNPRELLQCKDANPAAHCSAAPPRVPPSASLTDLVRRAPLVQQRRRRLVCAGGHTPATQVIVVQLLLRIVLLLRLLVVQGILLVNLCAVVKAPACQHPAVAVESAAWRSTPRMLQLRLLLDRQHAAQSNITFSGSLP
jgi:hypothetical protein